MTNEHGEEITLTVHRDRMSEFAPQIVQRHQTRLEGFDDKVIAIYARGMTTRDIQAHLKELHGTDVSPQLISNITDRVQEDAKIWQSRA